MNPGDNGLNFAPEATIPEAYGELSQEAFAVWIRLMIASDDELSRGRGWIAANLLNYSEPRANTILRELKRKGYVEFKPDPGRATTIIIKRRAKIVGRNRFVRLSYSIHPPVQESTKSGDPEPCADGHPGICTTSEVFAQNLNFESEASQDGGNKPRAALGKNSLQSHAATAAMGQFCHDLKSAPDPDFLCKIRNNAESLGKSHFEHHEKPVRFLHNSKNDAERKVAKKGKKPKQKFVTWDGGLEESRKQPTTQKSGGLYREKIREAKEKEKKNRLGAKSRRPQLCDENGDIVWSKLDKVGKPTFSFEMSPGERKQTLKILNLPDKTPRKRQLVQKIEQVTCQMYTRYRRVYNPIFELEDDERKYMRKFGVLCVKKGVTPRQALEYWAEHIKDFANKGMNLPTPGFLSSSNNIDSVAVASMEVTDGGSKKWKPDSFKRERTPVHGFSDTSRLNKGLRPGLTRAGFDVSKYSDRDLMTLQNAAQMVARGRKVFVSANMRDMVDWAAEHVYKESGEG